MIIFFIKLTLHSQWIGNWRTVELRPQSLHSAGDRSQVQEDLIPGHQYFGISSRQVINESTNVFYQADIISVGP